MSECPECAGTGEVYTPVTEALVTYFVRQSDGTDKGCQKIEKRGGLDACPVCAAKAETEWNMWR
jgi:hypothetical protein